jgi:hypothetical protein
MQVVPDFFLLMPPALQRVQSVYIEFFIFFIVILALDLVLDQHNLNGCESESEPLTKTILSAAVAWIQSGSRVLMTKN